MFKKAILFLIIIFCLFVLYAPSDSRAEVVRLCTLSQIGSAHNFVHIYLKGDGIAGWFRLPPEREKEFMAIALTAMSLERKVIAGFYDDLGWTSLYMLNMTLANN